MVGVKFETGNWKLETLQFPKNPELLSAVFVVG
jgi:hypothetical protein